MRKNNRKSDFHDLLLGTVFITGSLVSKGYEQKIGELQINLADIELRLKDALAFIEEKELDEDFNEWLHEHDLEKSS